MSDVGTSSPGLEAQQTARSLTRVLQAEFNEPSLIGNVATPSPEQTSATRILRVDTVVSTPEHSEHNSIRTELDLGYDTDTTMSTPEVMLITKPSTVLEDFWPWYKQHFPAYYKASMPIYVMERLRITDTTQLFEKLRLMTAARLCHILGANEYDHWRLNIINLRLVL